MAFRKMVLTTAGSKTNEQLGILFGTVYYSFFIKTLFESINHPSGLNYTFDEITAIIDDLDYTLYDTAIQLSI